MRVAYSIVALALPAVVLSQVAISGGGNAPGPMRVRVESLDSARSTVFRLQTRGARVRLITGNVGIAGDTVRTSTPAVIELESEPGQLALTSEAGPGLQIDITPTSGARVPRLVGTGRILTIARAQRGGDVQLFTNQLWAQQR